MTVRDLTFEVRRYFQKKPDDPGVIVSKVEPGSKGAVSGIKPYEIVTQVNDATVANIKDFEKLTAGEEELRLSLSHLTRSRIVKVKPGPPPEKPAKGKAGPKREAPKEEAPDEGKEKEGKPKEVTPPK